MAICEKCQAVGIKCQEEKNGRFKQIWFCAPAVQRKMILNGEEVLKTQIPIDQCPVIKAEETAEGMVERVKSGLNFRADLEIAEKFFP